METESKAPESIGHEFKAGDIVQAIRSADAIIREGMILKVHSVSADGWYLRFNETETRNKHGKGKDIFKLFQKNPSTVQEAADLLDLHYPGWENVIDPCTLDQRRVNTCVLGRLSAGKFYVAFQRITGKYFKDLCGAGEHLHPFGTGTTEEWRASIYARRAAAAPKNSKAAPESSWTLEDAQKLRLLQEKLEAHKAAEAQKGADLLSLVSTLNSMTNSKMHLYLQDNAKEVIEILQPFSK